MKDVTLNNKKRAKAPKAFQENAKCQTPYLNGDAFAWQLLQKLPKLATGHVLVHHVHRRGVAKCVMQLVCAGKRGNGGKRVERCIALKWPFSSVLNTIPG